MSKKILITGCEGMLGRRLMKSFSIPGEYVLAGVDLEQGDLSDPAVCKRVFENAEPDVVINAAAYTRVDECEKTKVYSLALAANAKIPKNLAALCRSFGTLLVHISTDYVYDGKKDEPYVEEDAPAPLSAYGITKLAGDKSVISSGCRFLIFRTAWLFGRYGNNFIEAILAQVGEKNRLTVVNDQFGSPTSTGDLAFGIKTAINKKLEGIYHFTCQGHTSWFEYAKFILETAGNKLSVEPISSGQLKLPAARPTNSRLNCEKYIDDTGTAIRHWKDAVATYIQK